MKLWKLLLLPLCLLYISSFAQFDELRISSGQAYDCNVMEGLCGGTTAYDMGAVFTDNDGHVIDMVYYDQTAGLRTMALDGSGQPKVNDYREKFATYPFNHYPVKVGGRLYYLFAICSKNACEIWAFDIDNVTGTCGTGHKIVTTNSLWGGFKIGYSEDKQRLAIYYHTDGGEKMADGYHPAVGYVVVDKSMRKIASGNALCPYANYKYEEHGLGLDSRNNVYVCYKRKGKQSGYEVLELDDRGTEARTARLDVDEFCELDAHFVESGGNVYLYGCTYRETFLDRKYHKESDLVISRLDMAHGKADQVAKTPTNFYTGLDSAINNYFGAIYFGGTVQAPYTLHIKEVIPMPDSTQVIIGNADRGFFIMRVTATGEIKWLNHAFGCNKYGRTYPVNYVMTADAVYVPQSSFFKKTKGPWSKNAINPKMDVTLTKFTMDGKVEQKILYPDAEIKSVSSSPDHKTLVAVYHKYETTDLQLLRISVK